MRNVIARSGLVLPISLSLVNPCNALDSYRFLHVTIETPWIIFIFLLFAVLAPFVLMGLLVWRYTEKRVDTEKQAETPPEGIE
jgi:hypothetical protein